MKTTIIHTHAVSGHHLEYLHHLYNAALSRVNERFVFLVPKQFEIESKKLNWPESNNIVVAVMGDDEVEPRNGSLIKKSIINSKTIRKYSNYYKATSVITLSIVSFLPFLPLFLKKVKISGIIYRIYLYEWKNESFIMKIQDMLKYWIMSRFDIFDRVYMCNDSASAHYLNKLFGVDKYRYMPDPVASILQYNGKDIRIQLGISESKLIFLHPGSLDSYKNTLGILRALMLLNKEDADKLAIVLAGRVVPGMREEFDFLYNKVKERVEIIFIEGYISFEKLADLFVTCDYVLVPYTVKGQSSGVIGHAAFYGKPVISVQGGVIGKMVRKWHLGYLLSDPSPDTICQHLKALINQPTYSTVGNDYIETHSIGQFCDVVLDSHLC